MVKCHEAHVAPSSADGREHHTGHGAPQPTAVFPERWNSLPWRRVPCIGRTLFGRGGAPAILGSCCGPSWGSEPLLVRASSVSGAVCAVALLVSRGDLTDSACPRGPISQAHLPLQGDTVACKQQCSQGLGRASHLGGTEEREEVVP